MSPGPMRQKTIAVCDCRQLYLHVYGGPNKSLAFKREDPDEPIRVLETEVNDDGCCRHCEYDVRYVNQDDV